MTRFQIVAIFNDKVLTAGEFNGDGYFEGGHGEEVCAAFPNIKTEEDYRKLVEKINESFGYKEQLIFELSNNNPQCDLFDFLKQDELSLYYEYWFSDYLYIINLSENNQEIVDETGKEITLMPNGWVTIHFGELYEQRDLNNKIKCRNNCEINNFNWFESICNKCGWSVSKHGTDIEVSKYSYAGEDFSFCIDADGDLAKQVSEYADDFNVDEHVKMWITSDLAGVPSSVRILLEDAERIDDDLQDLAEALTNRK